MIRYPFLLTDAQKEIKGIKKRWLASAASRTRKLLAAGCYNEKTSIWSDVKPVYMALQYNKCVFCERELADEIYGTIEHDLEHFRPKNGVNVWPTAVGSKYAFLTGGASTEGYYWLAYDLQNYATSCKVCNSKLKHSFFPIGGVRALPPGPALTPTHTPDALFKSEKPLLCYPLGSIDDDPEDLITFRGTLAIPVHTSGFKFERAVVIIDFFALNERQNLHRERARMLVFYGNALKNRYEGKASGGDLKLIANVSSPHIPHSSCVKSHAKMWIDDPELARRILELYKEYLSNKDASTPVI